MEIHLAAATLPRRAYRPAPRPIIAMIGFFGFMNVYSVQSVLPLLMHEFNASVLQVGATVGATVLAIALLSPFIGMISDAVGRKGLLCGAFVALSVPTALIAFSQTLDQVVLWRFVQGLLIPGVSVVIMAYIGEEFRGEQLARMMSALISGAVLGGFSGRFITGHVGEFLGWRGAFEVLAALNLAGALAAYWLLPTPRHFRPQRNIGRTLSTLFQHMRNPGLIGAAAVAFCVLFALVGVFTYINFPLAAEPYNLSSAALANLFCVYLLGVVITPLAGRLIPHFGYRKSLVIAVLCAACGILLTLAPALPVIIAGLAICACGTFMAQATAASFMASSVTEARSLASGLYNLTYYCGAAAGAWLTGIAYTAAGWPGAVASVCAVQCVAVTAAWFGWKRIK